MFFPETEPLDRHPTSYQDHALPGRFQRRDLELGTRSPRKGAQAVAGRDRWHGREQAEPGFACVR